ncbi:MAG TPA: condensation domain-containing protein, partial [Thermoanaerobaculia bacterium]|nr:condensation domain-containing protein [Thermoanaerobaculia bacterium]
EAVDATLDLAVLSVGADVWPVQDMERAVRRVAPHTRLVNSYGVTEASVDSSLCDCPLVRPFAGPVVPIGRPFPGTRLLVLDTALRPVPAGVSGELFLGGPVLARGYFGRPDLTAGRFVPDPFPGLDGQPGARLYRTGDRARLLPDGVVELLGRVDHQIKVRGVRIEPGEIEAALAGQTGVAQAVVVAAGPAADRRLVAFVVPVDPDSPPSVSSLRIGLRQRLPEALVPAAFEVLDSLPLTSNGKVDRRALGLLAAESGTPESSPAKPRTPVEEIVAGIFAEVLGEAAVVGIQDDFFELGGHSLLATQVVARLRAVFGVDLPLRRLFDVPTVAGLAAEIAALLLESPSEVPPLVPVPRSGGEALPLSFAQERLWFLEQLFPGAGLYHMPLVARLAGPLDAAALAWSLAAVVERHEILRIVCPAVEGRPVQRVVPARGIALPRIDLAALPGPQREAAAREWVEEASVRPFELGEAPPWRALLLRLGPEDHVLALVLHHIAADGWSLEVLIRDLSALYAGTPLQELAVQYTDFAVWQREWLQGEVLEGQLHYWRERLAGLPPALDLPFDRPRPAIPSGRGAVRGFTLPRLAVPLRGLGRQSGATLFMALLAGVEALLARLSGQTDIAVGTAVAGRERVETEGLIGLFINTLVLRCDLADDPAFLPVLLARAREAALGAYAHQTLPFERLVEELQPERAFSYTPLFQVMLALQNTPAAGLSLPGLRAEPAQAERRAAAFELGLQLFELG